MTVTSSHGRFYTPSICCAGSQLCQCCAGALVTMCTFFSGLPCGAPFFTLHVLSIIFSLGAEKQLKPLLTAANSATFPGCVLPPPSVPHRRSLFNYFPLRASRSQHELTTLQPPPKMYDSIDSTLSASTEASLRRLLSPNPHLSPECSLSLLQ